MRIEKSGETVRAGRVMARTAARQTHGSSRPRKVESVRPPGNDSLWRDAVAPVCEFLAGSAATVAEKGEMIANPFSTILPVNSTATLIRSGYSKQTSKFCSDAKVHQPG